MAEEKYQNPFEKHINSESFDISRLDISSLPPEFEAKLQHFFDTLPQPLDHSLWEQVLDEQQQLISAHVTLELVDRVMRVHFGDKVRNLRDDELIYLLTVPVTIAMLAEQRLHQDKAAEAPAVPEQPQSPPPAHPVQSPAEIPDWGIRLNKWLLRARDIAIRILRRRH